MVKLQGTGSEQMPVETESKARVRIEKKTCRTQYLRAQETHARARSEVFKYPWLADSISTLLGQLQIDCIG